MKKSILTLVTAALAAASFAAVAAAPANLVVTNKTAMFSNVAVNGGAVLGASHGTAANQTKSTPWWEVQLLCGLGTKTCKAEVYAFKDSGQDPATKVDLGTVQLATDTGVITVTDQKVAGALQTVPGTPGKFIIEKA